jgi:head-tail adaptor
MPKIGTATARTIRVQMLHCIVTENDLGQDTETITPGPYAFAQIKYSMGSERREAAAQGATSAATFIMPWSPEAAAMTERDMIRTDSGDWGIHGILKMDQYAARIEFTCVKRNG